MDLCLSIGRSCTLFATTYHKWPLKWGNFHHGLETTPWNTCDFCTEWHDHNLSLDTSAKGGSKSKDMLCAAPQQCCIASKMTGCKNEGLHNKKSVVGPRIPTTSAQYWKNILHFSAPKIDSRQVLRKPLLRTTWPKERFVHHYACGSKRKNRYEIRKRLISTYFHSRTLTRKHVSSFRRER